MTATLSLILTFTALYSWDIINTGHFLQRQTATLNFKVRRKTVRYEPIPCYQTDSNLQFKCERKPPGSPVEVVGLITCCFLGKTTKITIIALSNNIV